jgi:hypothetical protein
MNAPGHAMRDYPIDSAAHDLVALACHGFEPRPIDLKLATSIGFQRSWRPHCAHDMRDGGAADAQQFRQRFLGQREEIAAICPIVNVKQPARQAGFDGM